MLRWSTTRTNERACVALPHNLNLAAVLVAAEINHDRIAQASLRQSVHGHVMHWVWQLGLELPKPLNRLRR